MKQVFYKGLLALTIAFGFTSCDKNDVDDSNLQFTAADAKDNNFIHEVKFSETGGFIAPKGKSDAASKNAAEFASSHVYADADQVLTISNTAGVQYTGSYTAGDISSLDPSEIILGNGSYTAVSSNVSNTGLGIVSGFAPYTSTVSFDLSASASIQLAVTHERGFVIADSQRADGGLRITSVVLSAGDASGSLILDASDDFGDYYGYLEAGTYDVAIDYMLDGSAESVSGSVEIINGVASTLAPMLTPETPVSSETTTDTESINEAALAGDDLAAYNNNDLDFLDSISRVVSSTITTTSGTAGDPVFTYGPWSIVSDINVSASSATVTSTEAAEGEDVQPDGDEYDFIQRVVTTTVTSTDGTEVSDDVFGEWTLSPEGNRNSVSAGEDSGLGQFVPATYSAYAPDFGVQIANFMQTRTLTNGEANINPETVHVLSREVTVSSTGGVESTENSDEATLGRSINSDEDLLDTITRQVTSDEVYTASVAGTHTVVTANGSWSIVLDNDAVVADTVDSGAWILNADATAAVWEVTQGGNALDVPAFAPVAGPGADLLADGKRYVADDAFADLSVAIEDIPVVADIAGTITVDFTAASGFVWGNTGVFTVTAPDGATATADANVVTFNGAGEYVFALSNALGDTANYTATVSAAGDFTLSIGSGGVITFN